MEQHIQQAEALTKVDKNNDGGKRPAPKRKQRRYNRMDASSSPLWRSCWSF
ncbi:MAG: hypothetical protein ACLVJ6_12735 [Merdibacter sp.]